MKTKLSVTVTVAIVETMPEHLRSSHKAARNWGSYPHNGAERTVVPSDEVSDYVADGDEYDHVVCAYSATLDEDGISVHDAENHLLGTGTWNGSIVDCPATLGDDVYEALDAALLAAGAPSVEVEDDDCYVMTCASGAVVLVSAESAAQAEEAWDAEAERYECEPRVTSARPATHDDVEGCVDSGHDYR